jgi:hypothetical protein
MLGRTLLVELAKSELPSEEERALAETLLTEEARFDPRGTDLRLVAAAPELNAVVFVQDDEGNEKADDQGGQT